ncbi:hypothetical protein MMC12_007736 [Toensbergia leucococca]|nr:hypothetical protein [Toensbergia leucococca]
MTPDIRPRRNPSRRNLREIPSEETQDAINEGPADDYTPSNEDLVEIIEVHPDDPAPSLPHTSPAAIPTPRRPVQRLASLYPRSSPNSSSIVSASREAGDRPIGLKFQPKSFIRRSKEERDAQVRAEEERRQARLAANPIPSTSIGGRGSLRGRGRGRGDSSRDVPKGHTGPWRFERIGGSQASGVLGGSTVYGDGEKRGRGARGGSRLAGSSAPSTSETTRAASTRVKREPALKSEKDKDGDIEMAEPRGRRLPEVKREDQESAYVSSEEEPDPAEGPRVNIEHINLVSDEDTEESPEETKGKEHEKAANHPGRTLKPVRIDRHEHVERAINVNTDASSLTSAELRKRAKERNEAQGSLFLPQEEESKAVEKPRAKGRARAKEVEFVRDERRWKGVYQDEDMEDEATIKQEPMDDDHDAMVVDSSEFTNQVSATLDTEMTSELVTTNTPREPRDDDLLIDPIQHSPPIYIFRDSVPSTKHIKEDKGLLDLEDLNADKFELLISGSLSTDANTVPLPTNRNLGVANHPKVKHNTKPPSQQKEDGHVYLFQFPPLIPTLTFTPRKDIPMQQSQPLKSAPPQHPDPIIIKPDSDDAPTSVKIPNALMAEDTDVAQGNLGALKAKKKARIFTRWGGARMEVGRGVEGGMLREIVVLDLGGVKAKKDENEEEKMEGEKRKEGKAGKSVGIGLLGEGFVLMPDWGGLFGG